MNVAGIKAFLGRFWYPRHFLLVGVPLVAAGAGGAWGSWQNLCAGESCPSIAQIETWEPEQTSKLVSHDGRLIAEIGFERRTPVALEAMPEYVPQAVVAIEDHRFYEHNGFDPRGIARAVFGVLTFQSLGGGSTITQQLARNMFDQIGTERRWNLVVQRKFREIQVALDLERTYSKDQILEAYINEIYMGRGYGFQSAARAYFGKNVTEVNVAEAALLAAILNLPGVYNPFRNPEAAKRRRDLVLTRMADVGYLTRAEAEEWKRHPLPIDEPAGTTTGIAPYFEEWVRQILQSRFGDQIYRSGLRVHTTLDIEMQQAATEAMQAGWASIESDPSFLHPKFEEFDTVTSFAGQTPYLQGAFIAMDPATGHVKAMIGGRDFEQSKFDRARLARRQAGSSFKPFVYTAAIASRIPASHVIVDAPVVYPQPDGRDWRPSNFEPEFLGPITIREGLYRSKNMIAIKLGWEEVGIETVRQTARRMGIRSTEIEPYPSTTIGAAEVIPMEMVEAYSAFPNLGTKVVPFPILRVEDAAGQVIWEPEPERTQVLEAAEARIMVSMLEDVVMRGTGYTAVRVRGLLPFSVPAAGKTGTTNDGTDVWFAGFTPSLLAVTWFGMDSPMPIFELGPGYRQATGGGLAGPVWAAFMKRVYTGRPPTFAPLGTTLEDARAAEDERVEQALATDSTLVIEPLLDIPEPWPIVPGLRAVLVDRATGKLASRWCDEADQYVEYYLPGTEPTELCDRRSDRRFRVTRIRH